jgi:hypothetical protein
MPHGPVDPFASTPIIHVMSSWLIEDAQKVGSIVGYSKGGSTQRLAPIPGCGLNTRGSATYPAPVASVVR